MPVSWGAWQNVSNGKWRAGVEISSVSGTGQTATVRVDFWVNPSGFNMSESELQEIELVNSPGSTTKITSIPDFFVAGGSQTKVLTRNFSVTKTSSSQTFTTQGRFKSYTAGWSPSASDSATIPAYVPPPPPPDPPYDLTVARDTDTKQDLAWTRGDSYSSQRVQRRTVSDQYPNWVIVASSISGGATSWTDPSTQTDKKYEYRVLGYSTGGWSGPSNTASISTTPAIPARPTAAKDVQGDVIVTAPSISGGSATHWEVWHAADGVWDGSPLATDLPLSQTTVTHSAPSAVQVHTYRIRTISSNPKLYSGYSAVSDPVDLLAPPDAPSDLQPNGGAVESNNGSITGSWSHNPVDTTPQTKYQLRWRVAGTSTWTTGSEVASQTSEGTLPFSNGDTYEWQVRTWGLFVDPSPWSPTAQVDVSARPIATTVSPAAGAEVSDSVVTLTWSFFDPDGGGQTAAEVKVTDITGGGSTPVTNAQITGNTLTWDTPTLPSAREYSWEVRAQGDVVSQWSDWDSSTFSVNVDPPAPPIIDSLSWSGTGYISVVAHADSLDGLPETVSLNLERSIEGGPWVTLATGLPTSFEYQDWTAHPSALNTYRVTAVSAIPSTESTEDALVLEPDESCGEVWISGGAGGYIVAHFQDVVKQTGRMGRNRTLNRYEGRELPVETSGRARTDERTITAVLISEPICDSDDTIVVTSLSDIKTLFNLPGPHLYRDSEGEYLWASLSLLDYDPGYLGEISFTVTATDPGSEEDRQEVAAYLGPMVIEVMPGEYTVVGGTLESTGDGQWEWTP